MQRDITFIFKARDQARRAVAGLSNSMRGLGRDTQQAARRAAELEQRQRRVRQEIERLRAARARVAALRAEINALTAATNRAGISATGLRSAFGFTGGVAAALAIRDLLSTYAGFEQQLANVRAVANATDDEFMRLTETAKQLGSTTEFTGRQAGAGLEFLVRAGFTADQAIASLPATLDLATASGLELGRSADIVSNIMSTFQLEVAKTSEATDILATVNSNANTNISQLAEAIKLAGPIANGFGVSLNETAAAIGVLGDSGLQGSLAGTGIRMALIDASLLSAGNAAGNAQELFDQLGIAPEQFDPERVGISGFIEALRDANVGTQELTTLFGARAAPAVLTLINGFDKLEELTAKTGENVGEAARQAAVTRDTLLGDWRALRSAIEGAFIAIGETIGPALRTTVQFATSVIQALQGADVTFERFEAAAVATAEALTLVGKALLFLTATRTIGFLARAGGAFLSLGSAVASTIGTLGVLRGSLVALGLAIRAVPILGWVILAIEGISRLRDVTVEWGGVVTSVGEIVSVIWSRIVGTIRGAFDSAREGVRAFFEAFQTGNTALNSILSSVAGVVGRVVGLIRASLPAIGNVVNGIVSIYVGTFNAILVVARAFVTGLSNTFQAVRAVVAFVADIFRTLGFIIGESFSRIGDFIEPAIDSFVQFAQRVAEIAGRFSVFLQPIFSAVSAVRDFIAQFVNGSVQLFAGMVDAIAAVLTGLGPAISNAFATALNAAIDIVVQGINFVLDQFRSLLSFIDSASGALGRESNLAGRIGTVSGEGLKLAIQEGGTDLAGKITEAFNRGEQDYVGQLGNLAQQGQEVATQAATGAIDGIVAEIQSARAEQGLGAAEQAAAAARNNAARNQTTIPTLPGQTDTETDVTTPTRSRTGGGGGGATAASLNIVKDIVEQNRDLVRLSQFSGRELKLQEATLEAVNRAKQEGVTLSEAELRVIRESTNEALNAQEARERINGYRELFRDNFSQGINDALDQGELNFGSFISSLGQQLRQTAIDNFVNVLFEQLPFLSFGGGGGGGGGFLSNLFGGGGGGFFGGIGSFLGGIFADGGIMSSQGRVPLRQYQDGGIARSPQLALFGEGSVPEAYVPVPSGRIPVEVRGDTAQGMTVVVNMNVQATDADSFQKSRPQIISDLQTELTRQGARNQ